MTSIWNRIDKSGGLGACWEWQGFTRGGYAAFGNGRTGNFLVKRLAYEELIGPIPEGLVLHHLCWNRGCCNPYHLEPVPNGEQVRRSPITGLANTFGGMGARTHCKNGHEWNSENTHMYRHPRTGWCRSCRACCREKMRKRRRQAREEAA